MAVFRLGEWLVEPQLNIISNENKTIKEMPKIMQVLICLTRTLWASRSETGSDRPGLGRYLRYR
jgi:hypothetical protein